ncbi:MAG: hypothetical protein CVT89_09270, partial [Candidatus Altiarchaeales archaeon HGW-Altiarchaeales-2]
MLIENGPLTVGVDAGWQSDSQGILYCTSDFQWFTHGMVLVGYNDTGQYWILKNSWGNWGHNGYGYIKYDNCLVESNVQKFAYPKNGTLGNFSSGGTIFISNTNNSTSFNEEIELVKDNIILDCNNAVIDGNNVKGIGMWIIAKNTTVKNCIVKNFVYGMVLDTSSSDNLINNTLTSNDYGIYVFNSIGVNSLINNTLTSNTYGIYQNNNQYYFNEILNNEILNNAVGIFSSSSYLIINENTVCGNTQLNFNST